MADHSSSAVRAASAIGSSPVASRTDNSLLINTNCRVNAAKATGLVEVASTDLVAWLQSNYTLGCDNEAWRFLLLPLCCYVLVIMRSWCG